MFRIPDSNIPNSSMSQARTLHEQETVSLQFEYGKVEFLSIFGKRYIPKEKRHHGFVMGGRFSLCPGHGGPG